MSRILAVANIKGGVGKTTTVVNLAAALAERDNRVLAVDLDPQSSLTLSMGMRPDQVSVTIRHLLESGSPSLLPIQETPEHWDFIPANADLRLLEHELETTPHRIPQVAAGLQPLREKYDFILLDCPASTGPLIGAGLAAADQVVIPLTPDYLSFQVSRSLFRIIRAIRQKINPRLQIAGIYLTMYDTRTRNARDFMTTIRHSYEDVPFFSAVVRHSVKVREAPAFGQSVLRYAPDSQAAKAYRVIANEILFGIAAPVCSKNTLLSKESERSLWPVVVTSAPISAPQVRAPVPVSANTPNPLTLTANRPAPRAQPGAPGIPAFLLNRPAAPVALVAAPTPANNGNGGQPVVPHNGNNGHPTALQNGNNGQPPPSHNGNGAQASGPRNGNNGHSTGPHNGNNGQTAGPRNGTNRHSAAPHNGNNSHTANPSNGKNVHNSNNAQNDTGSPTRRVTAAAVAATAAAAISAPAASPRRPVKQVIPKPHPALGTLAKKAAGDSHSIGLERDLQIQCDQIMFSSTVEEISELVEDGEVLKECGYYSHAERMFQRASELAPTCVEAWLGWARVTSDPLQRVTLLQKALYLQPGRELRSELAVARLELQEYAYRLLEEGTVNRDAERMAKSHQLFRLAVSIDPADERAWLGCARTADNLVEKMNYLQQALKLNPQNKQALELAAILGSFVKAEPTERWNLKANKKGPFVLGIVLTALVLVFFALPWILSAF